MERAPDHYWEDRVGSWEELDEFMPEPGARNTTNEQKAKIKGDTTARKRAWRTPKDNRKPRPVTLAKVSL